MVRCKRCNKFIFRISKTVYCKACNRIVQREEELRRIAEAKRLQEEEELRRIAEAKRLQEEEEHRKEEQRRKEAEQLQRKKELEDRKRKAEKIFTRGMAYFEANEFALAKRNLRTIENNYSDTSFASQSRAMIQEIEARQAEEKEKKRKEAELQKRLAEERRLLEEAARKAEEERRLEEEAKQIRAEAEQIKLQAASKRTQVNISDMHRVSNFHTKVVGVTFKNDDDSDRQTIIRVLIRAGLLDIGEELQLIPQPSNPYDRNCIRVVARNGQQIGTLPKNVAARVAPRIEKGSIFKAYVASLQRSNTYSSYGISVRIEEYEKKEPATYKSRSLLPFIDLDDIDFLEDKNNDDDGLGFYGGKYYTEETWHEEHMNPWGTEDVGDGYITSDGVYVEY